MADRLRQFAQRLKSKLSVPQIGSGNRDKVEQIINKYVPATKVTAIAEKFKTETISMKVRELVSKYEKFTGVEEIMALQTTVIAAQERFMIAQDQRRDLGRQLANLEARLKELHAEMQNTMKGEEKYLHQCTEEHKLIIQERALRTLFAEAEREERELFAAMSAAVKLGHERERAHAERNKYWYIVASIFGTVLGIAGSTFNNRLKMAEFRDLLQQQLARSAGALAAGGRGGAGGGAGGGDGGGEAAIAGAMQAELAYQEQLAQNIDQMQNNIDTLVNKQTAIMDHLHRQSRTFEAALRELSRAVASAALLSERSDASLTAALNAVHHDLEDTSTDKDRGREKENTDKWSEKEDREEGQGKLMVGITCLIAGVALASLIPRS